MQVGLQHYKVTIRQVSQHLTPIKEVMRQPLPSSMADDIWSDEDQKANQIVFSDPFSQSRSIPPVQTKLKPVVSTPIQHDPLDFLYHDRTVPVNPNQPPSSAPLLSNGSVEHTSFFEPTPNYDRQYSLQSEPQKPYPAVAHSESPYRGDVLRDLNIDINTPAMTQRQYTEPTNSFFEQAPIEHLDQYLTHDDEPYWNQDANTAHALRTVNNSPELSQPIEKRDWLSGPFGLQKSKKG